MISALTALIESVLINSKRISFGVSHDSIAEWFSDMREVVNRYR